MEEIHVAIPVHNNAAGLRQLLSSIVEQPFSSITVLDDASTDDIDAVLQDYPTVIRVRSEVNLGTVGANNLILERMPESGWLLCIDSDMEVQTADTPVVLSEFLAMHPNTGAGVGRIIGTDGGRVRWNFNYDISPLRSLLAMCTFYPAIWLRTIPLLGTGLRRLSLIFTQHLAADVDQKIDWGIEGFFFVRVDLWQQLGGFDSRFKRFHEGPDLFLQIRKRGFETWYTPTVVAYDTDQASGTSWYRRYHYVRSLVIYFYKNPSRLLLWRYPRP